MHGLPADTAAWLRLLLTPGVGNATMRRLLAAFFTPENVFAQSVDSWRAVVTKVQASALQREPADYAQQCEKLAAWLAVSAHHHFLPLGHPDYPASLLQMEDPPCVLYVQCAQMDWWRSWCATEQTPLLAIVGSRNPTPQGEKNAQQFAQSLVQSGWGVVSGMALGIDGAAHRAALVAGGKTIAVVGTGLDRVYPRQHHELAHQIVSQGAVVSEFPLGTAPLAGNFPKRNRLIAGLTRGTLVVEANLQSGSLITARLATEQGKEVFAIPGSIHAPQAKGCHLLIQQGAKLVQSVQDVLDELLPIKPINTAQDATKIIATKLPTQHTSVQTQILHAMAYDPIALDELQARTGYDAATLQTQLLELELAALIHRLPGGRYQRMGQA